MTTVEENIQQVKEIVTKPLPSPPPLTANSSAKALKDRLNWGEPGLTIIDVRDRQDFNNERIMGAMSMPLDTLVETATRSLTKNRDIYVYGNNDEETAQAVKMLREAGFTNVAHIEGGMVAWKDVKGSLEGPFTYHGPVVRFYSQGE